MCYTLRITTVTYMLSGSFFIFEVCFVRLLYTTVWQNLGLIRCDFWKRFAKVFNVFVVFFIGIIFYMVNISKGFDVAMCSNIPPDDFIIDAHFAAFVRDHIIKQSLFNFQHDCLI